MTRRKFTTAVLASIGSIFTLPRFLRAAPPAKVPAPSEKWQRLETVPFVVNVRWSSTTGEFTKTTRTLTYDLDTGKIVVMGEPTTKNIAVAVTLG